MKNIQLLTTLIAALSFIVIFGGAFLGGNFELFTAAQYVPVAKLAATIGAPCLFVSYLFSVNK